MSTGQSPIINLSLFITVATADDNSYGANCCGGPKPKNLPSIPPTLASLVGAILVVSLSKFLFYAMDRGGKFADAVFFSGFPLFLFGVILLLFCFLPKPPPIIWFTIEPWWHWIATYTSAKFTFSLPIAAITANRNVAGNVPRLSLAAIEFAVSQHNRIGT